MKQLSIILAVLLCIAGPAWGQDKPTADEARKVIDYYYNGKGQGAVLMDLKICGGIGQQEGVDKNECLNKVDPARIQTDQELFLWMNFLIPLDDTADVIVAFSRSGKVRRTSSIKLTTATRYRTWKRIPTDKAGQWSISFLQELADKDLDLGGLQYTVVESAQ